MKINIKIIFITLISVNISFALTACSDSGSDPATIGTPTIIGIPALTVEENTPYSFTPSASDPDGDALTFSINSNIPVWASFDPQTGELAGLPTHSHIGDYPNIVISVTDGSSTVSLEAFDIKVTATLIKNLQVNAGADQTTTSSDILSNIESGITTTSTSSTKSSKKKIRQKKKRKKLSKSTMKQSTTSKVRELSLPTITLGWSVNDAHQYRSN